MSHRRLVALSRNTLVFASLLAACSSGSGPGTVAVTGGSPTTGGAAGGTQSATGGGYAGATSGTGGQTSTGGRTSSSVGGSVSPTGGAAIQTGGSLSPTGGATTQRGGTTGQTAGSAGGSKGGNGGGPGGGQGGTSVGTGGAGGRAAGDAAVGGAGGGCTAGTWPTVDPSVAGPYAVTQEGPVGPTAGADNAQFDVIRPTDLTKTDLCHPLVTWGNGHGDNPPTYMVLLKQLASHGFVVVASLTKTASQGTPLPQIAGIDWILQENDTPTSIYYKRIDTTHIGATGHSEGGMATSKVASDSRVKAVATICGWVTNSAKQCPGLYLCGGQDTMATCTGMQSAFDGSPAPLIWASQLTATHGSWIGSIKDPFMIAVTGWFRYHLMGDTAQKKMFYGTDCTICTNTAQWKILGQKGMDP